MPIHLLHNILNPQLFRIQHHLPAIPYSRLVSTRPINPNHTPPSSPSNTSPKPKTANNSKIELTKHNPQKTRLRTLLRQRLDRYLHARARIGGQAGEEHATGFSRGVAEGVEARGYGCEVFGYHFDAWVGMKTWVVGCGFGSGWGLTGAEVSARYMLLLWVRWGLLRMLQFLVSICLVKEDTM